MQRKQHYDPPQRKGGGMSVEREPDLTREVVDLCKDCVNYAHGMCLRPNGKAFSYVRGHYDKNLFEYAESERRPNRVGWFGKVTDRCGPYARYFEARPKVKPPKGGSGVRRPATKAEA